MVLRNGLHQGDKIEKSISAFIIITIIGILWAIPLYVLIICSLKDVREVLTTSIFLPPSKPNLNTFFITIDPMLEALMNTSLEVLAAATISAILGSLSAYAFYRYTSKIKYIILIVIAIATYIPYQSVMVPLAIFIRSLGFYDTVWGVFSLYNILHTNSLFCLQYLFHQYQKS
jgi:glucose/arabinose transport system permease protein